MAATVRVRNVKRTAMLSLELSRRLLRSNVLDLDPIALQDAFAHFQRLAKLVAGVQVKNADARLDLGQHVDEATTLGPERRRHRETRMVAFDRPAQDRLWRLSLQELIDFRQLGCRQTLRHHRNSLSRANR